MSNSDYMNSTNDFRTLDESNWSSQRQNNSVAQDVEVEIDGRSVFTAPEARPGTAAGQNETPTWSLYANAAMRGVEALRSRLSSNLTVDTVEVDRVQANTDKYTQLLLGRRAGDVSKQNIGTSLLLTDAHCHHRHSRSSIERARHRESSSASQNLRETVGDADSDPALLTSSNKQTTPAARPSLPAVANGSSQRGTMSDDRDLSKGQPAVPLNLTTDTTALRMRPVSVASSSVGNGQSVASSIFRVTDEQRDRLRAYGHKLRQELTQIRQETRNDTEDGPGSRSAKVTSDGKQHHRRKKAHNKLDDQNRDPKLQHSTPHKRKQPVMTIGKDQGKENEDATIGDATARLYERLARLRDSVLADDDVENDTRKQKQHRNESNEPRKRSKTNDNKHQSRSIHDQRLHSDPTSPSRCRRPHSPVIQRARSLPRRVHPSNRRHCKRSSVAVRPPANLPFVAGKATAKSHSVKVNWQQLLASLKNENHVLHQACLRITKASSSRNAGNADLAELFRDELGKQLEQLEEQLDRDLRLYDALQTHVQQIREDAEQRLAVLKDVDDLVTKIEVTDTKISRIKAQMKKYLSQLEQPSCDAEMALDSVCTVHPHLRACKHERVLLIQRLQQAQQRRRLEHAHEPTLASLHKNVLLQKENHNFSSPKQFTKLGSTLKSPATVNESQQCLRGLKQLRTAFCVD